MGGCKRYVREDLYPYLGGESGEIKTLHYRVTEKIRKIEPVIWEKLKSFFGVQELWGEIKIELFFFKGSILRCRLHSSRLRAYGKGAIRSEFELCKFLQTSDWSFVQYPKPFSMLITLKKEEKRGEESLPDKNPPPSEPRK